MVTFTPKLSLLFYLEMNCKTNKERFAEIPFFVQKRRHEIVFGNSFLVHHFVLFLVLCFAVARDGCLTCIVFWMSRCCYCHLPLPHGAVGWSVVCKCVISWSYSVAFCLKRQHEV